VNDILANLKDALYSLSVLPTGIVAARHARTPPANLRVPENRSCWPELNINSFADWSMCLILDIARLIFG